MIAKSMGELLLAVLLLHSAEGAGLFVSPAVEAPRIPATAMRALVQSASAETFRLPTADDRDAWPRLHDTESVGVEVTAESAIVVDREYGKVLFEKKADAVRPIASLTKLMSVLVALESDVESKTFTFSAGDLAVVGSNSFRAGDTVSGHELILASLIASANEAAAALVPASGLPEDVFVNRMNKKARELGMARTFFVDPTGLDARNVSTARDIVRLLEALREKPLVREAARYATVEIPVGEGKFRTIRTTDLLLKSFLAQNPYHIAVAKTGSLEEAGFCLGASIDQGQHGVYAVVLDSNTHFSRFEDMKALVYWAYDRWEWPTEAL
ncbi:MAG: serine hydrolase [bacterium]|nr:serine hydrolase [bacterium]